MCTANEEFQILQELKKDQNFEDTKICLKCKNNIPVVFLRSDGVYCKDCFIQRITHKFRLEFGKSHLIRDNEKVLVYIEFNKFSLILLHLINEGLSKKAKKKLRFVPLCVFIIEENSNESINEIISKFTNSINNFELPICIYQVNQIYKNDVQPIYSNIELPSPVEFYNKEDFEEPICFKNKTSKITFNNILKGQLLVRIASKHGISKVITSENADQLASNLIVNVIEGRGDQISYQMGFLDDRNDDILFVRPLKNFTTAEVDAYYTLNSLDNILPLTYQVQNEYTVYNSMHELTESFLKKLQANNENTLPIICRIGEKFSPVENSTMKCLLCKTPFILDTSLNVILTNGDTINCEKASKINFDNGNKTNGTKCGNDTCNDICTNSFQSDNRIEKSFKKQCCMDKNKSKSSLFGIGDLLKYSCYGCKILINDMKNCSELPVYILNDLKKIKNRESMRETVKEYLLND